MVIRLGPSRPEFRNYHEREAARLRSLLEPDPAQYPVNSGKGSEEETDRLSNELRAVRDKIDEGRPVTLRGALAVLDLGELIDDRDWWPDEAIEGLREIAEKEGGPAT